MQKIVKLNRAFLYCCMVVIFCLHFKGYAAPTQGKPVSITIKNSSLAEVLRQVSKKSGLYIYFQDADLAGHKNVTIDVKNKPVENVLHELLDGRGFSWVEVSENTIAVKKKSEPEGNKIGEDTVATITVTGRVVNEKGEPVIGATVLVKGSKMGTLTNAVGDFVLNDVKANAGLVISNVSFLTVELFVNGRKSLGSIKLREYVGELDETVVIAYGTTTKRLATGNISSVKAREIEMQPVNNPLLALQGRVPGLFIEQASGLPGSGVKVRIQGLNSLNKGNDPLYVIDGVPYSSQLLPSINGILGSSGDGGFNVVGNPLSFISPNDIESIDILKDADATSIYGSRAAAGAILITTKKGKPGRTKVDINIQNGWGKVTRKMKLLNTPQYLEMRHEAIKNDGIDINNSPYNEDFYKVFLFQDVSIWGQNNYTDWQKELIGGTAKYKDIRATISGGSSNTNFLIGANFRKETTVFPGDLNDQKGSVNFNLNNVSSNGKFRAALTGYYMVDNNRLQTTDLTNTAITLAPNAPKLYDSNGHLNWEPYRQADGSYVSTFINPLIYMNNLYKIKTNNFISNALLSYQILAGLEVKCSLGFTNLQTNDLTTAPNSSFQPEYRQFDWAKGTANFGYGNINSWTVEPQITYQRTISKGKIDGLLGATYYELNNSRQVFNAQGFNSDLQLENIKAATQVQVDNNIGSIISKYKYNAFFGRLSYNWSDKYIISTTFRRDGSSRFGANNRFHNFGSLSGVWVFSEETVLKALDFLSFGKLRISYGTTGNDQIGDYTFLSLYNSITGDRPYQGSNGLQAGNLQNQYIQWEQTRKTQIGLDLGFFNDRLLVNANYFRNRSSNQLLNYSLPGITGQTGILVNFPATIQNSGWEFLVNSINFQSKGFSWSSSVNLTVPSNKLVDFPNLAMSTLASKLIVGQPISIQQIYRYGGVDPSSGVYQFYDKDQKLTTVPGGGNENRTAIVNTNPRFYGGLTNSFSYKGFQLNVLFQFVKQIGESYYFGYNPGQANTNEPITVLDRWQKEGDVKPIQRYNTYFSNSLEQQSFAMLSDKAYSDASYIRLKNFSVYWQLPQTWRQKLKFDNARVYFLGQNLLTLTGYDGIDPENRSIGSLPPLRVMTVGVNLTL